MKWLYRIVSLLYGCRHKWEHDTVHKKFETPGDNLPVRVILIQRCRKCGDLKKVTVS